MGPEFDRSRRRRIDRLDDDLAAGDGLLAEVEAGDFDAARCRIGGARGQRGDKSARSGAGDKGFHYITSSLCVDLWGLKRSCRVFSTPESLYSQSGIR